MYITDKNKSFFIFSFFLLIVLLLVKCDTPFSDKSDDQARVIYFQSQYTKELSYFLVFVPKEAETPTPVLYLLNGYNRNPYGWANMGFLQEDADENDIIIVSISSGRNGVDFYVDSIIDSTKMYEGYVLEIIKIVDDNYDTGKSRYFRAISGISMGAMGAVYISSRHPEMFISASAISGGIYDGSISGNNIAYYPDYDNLKNIKLLIDIGTNDSLLENARKLHNELLKRNISHLYNEDYGGHTNDFVKSHYKSHIKFHREEFDKYR